MDINNNSDSITIVLRLINAPLSYISIPFELNKKFSKIHFNVLNNNKKIMRIINPFQIEYKRSNNVFLDKNLITIKTMIISKNIVKKRAFNISKDEFCNIQIDITQIGCPGSIHIIYK